MCCLSPYCHLLCRIAVAWRISKVKIFFYRNHMHMCRKCNICIIKYPCSDHLTLTTTKFDSFFFQAGTLICINIFFCRNRKKIHIAIQLVLYFRISHCNRTANHRCHLCMVSAGMSNSRPSVSHRMRMASDRIQFAYHSQSRTAFSFHLAFYSGNGKMLLHFVTE